MAFGQIRRTGSADCTKAIYEAVNLSFFAFSRLSQIKDLAGMKGAKTGKIYKLYRGCDGYMRSSWRGLSAADARFALEAGIPK